MNTSDFLFLLLIALGLSMDCFTVALSISVANKKFFPIQMFHLALSFGIFQAVMPLLGWLLGQVFIDIIANYDHWVAFILLGFVGGRMLWEAFHPEPRKSAISDTTKGLSLLTLSVATSIDALAVGLSLAFINIPIGIASTIIGIVTIISTVTGFLLGRKVGELLGKNLRLSVALSSLALV